MGVVAVDLDREAELPPQHVHLEAVDSLVQLETGQARLAKQAKHLPLGRRAGASRAAGKVEDGSQRGVAALAGVAFELFAKLRRARQPPVVGLGDEPLEVFRAQLAARSRIVRGGLVRGIRSRQRISARGNGGAMNLDPGLVALRSGGTVTQAGAEAG